MWNFRVKDIVILYIIVSHYIRTYSASVLSYHGFDDKKFKRVGSKLFYIDDIYLDYNYEIYDIVGNIFDEEEDSPGSSHNNNNEMTLYIETSTVSIFDANTTSINNTEEYDSVTLRYNDTDIENLHTNISEKNILYREWKGVKEKMCLENEICARKCCPDGEAYSLQKHSCIPTTYQFRPRIWQSYSYRDDIDATKHFMILHGRLSCRPDLGEVMKLTSEISEVFRLGADGHFYVENNRAMSPELEFMTNKYCLDFFVNTSGYTYPDAQICYVPDEIIEKHYLLSGICMVVTCFLVLLRLLVFAWVPELQTLHGQILMAYLISFMVGFLLLGLEEFLMMKQFVDDNICVTLTVIVYFSTLSAFFWRNVMCYDIWWTFSGLRSASVRSSAGTRFRLYCVYAFGGPIALTIVLSSIEYSDLPKEHPLMPRIRTNCFLFGYGRLLYFLAPLMLLFVMNMIFFARTTVNIAATKRQTKVVFQSKDSNYTQVDIQWFTLYVKLFGSMAFLEVNLILEVITILYSDGVNILHFTDIFNVFALLVIVVNFLCRSKTWRVIKKRYRTMRGLPVTPTMSAERTLNSMEKDSTVTHL